MNSKHKPLELSEEVKNQYRHRLRTLIRRVAINRAWLEATEEERFTLNAKRNIAMVFRQKREQGILTNIDRTILRKDHNERTVPERKMLVKLLMNLPCFARYSPKVRARLAPYVNFMLLKKNRSLIKQGKKPFDVYFVIAGELEIIRRQYDDDLTSYTDESITVAGPGDCIGDVEFCEGTERLTSCIATCDTEVLVVYEEAFNKILYSDTIAQWMDRRRALNSLHYFQYFTNNQIVTAVKLCKIRQYQALDSIYLKDEGMLNYAYFVLSGECMILQCLKMKVITKRDKKIYRLVEVGKGEESIFQAAERKDTSQHSMAAPSSISMSTIDLTKDLADIFPSMRLSGQQNLDAQVLCETFQKRQNEAYEKQMAEIAKRLESEQRRSLAMEESKLSIAKHSDYRISEHLSVEELEIAAEKQAADESEEAFDEMPVTMSQEMLADETAQDVVPEAVLEADLETRNEVDQETNEEAVDATVEATVEATTEATVEETIGSETDARASAGQNENMEKGVHIEFDEKSNTLLEIAARKSDSRADIETAASVSFTSTITGSTTEASTAESLESSTELKKLENFTTETHFIDVGTISFGGVFGLGEEMKHRVIMARTPVQCILLPRFWLFEKQQNPANIWQQRLILLRSSIPDRQKVFEHFEKSMKWKKYRTDLVNSYVEENTVSTTTKVEDIPIICNILGGK